MAKHLAHKYKSILYPVKLQDKKDMIRASKGNVEQE